MKIRANSNAKFLRRFLIIAAVCLGYGCWCLYDSFVTGPKHTKKSEAYWVKGEEDGVAGWVPRHSEEEWSKIAQENHWPIGKPKTPSEAQGFLYYNYILAAICLTVGTVVLVKYFGVINAWIEADEKGLTASWGQEFSFDAINKIDKKKWEHKGIAKVYYSHNDSEKRFVLDDFKFLRQETDEILVLMEKGLKDDQIINGPREKALPSSHEVEES